ncbi:type IV toxin-antitoxin system AbiEi family antitoxin domain-containing protein [Herbiconiux daphne]|uniref:DUF559 domain-containing protein n=1 Tax=Herbiconiux daphne TaxID=2970914 RepID=A0ABT2H4F9_9MICO|nr:type IV toxin-antitoxin system AbiEi family antitoxin domain-containing protein [Herbiconiux daphne]MCS5734820.1 hypothetical protein [Herbiconiux daphne]
MSSSFSFSRPAVITTRELLERGASPGGIQALTESGRLTRVRRGVFVTAGAPNDLVRAARIGGRLTDVSALRLHGAWSRPDPRLHVQLPHSFGRARDPDTGQPLRARDDVVAHWSRALAPRDRLAYPGVAPLAAALRGAATSWAPHEAVAALDSVLHRRLISRGELAATFEGSSRAQRLLADADRRAESGIESIARVRFTADGLECTPQVWIAPKIRVDLLIDGWLVIELDGRESHGSADASSRDYRRDAEVVLRGFGLLHFDYHQVMSDWSTVLAATRSVLFAGRDAFGRA